MRPVIDSLAVWLHGQELLLNGHRFDPGRSFKYSAYWSDHWPPLDYMCFKPRVACGAYPMDAALHNYKQGLHFNAFSFGLHVPPT